VAIPDYQTVIIPVLRLAAERERLIRECADLVADEFALTLEEREELAEIAAPRPLFAAILRRIERLRGPPALAT
jgi:hypothetical protein